MTTMQKFSMGLFRSVHLFIISFTSLYFFHILFHHRLLAPERNKRISVNAEHCERKSPAAPKHRWVAFKTLRSRHNSNILPENPDGYFFQVFLNPFFFFYLLQILSSKPMHMSFKIADNFSSFTLGQQIFFFKIKFLLKNPRNRSCDSEAQKLDVGANEPGKI